MSTSSTDLVVTMNLGRSVLKVSHSLPLLPPCLYYLLSFRHFLLSVPFPAIPSPVLSFFKTTSPFFYFFSQTLQGQKLEAGPFR